MTLDPSPEGQDQSGQEGSLVSASVEWNYALPHPQILNGYNGVLENGAERLFQWAQEESQHRRGIEQTMVNSETSLAARGQIIAAVIVTLALLGGLALIWFGKSVPLAIGLLVGVGLAGLAAVFTRGR